MFLEALRGWTDTNRARLEAAGIQVALSEPSTTSKPAQTLTLSASPREADVIVWVSGECETAIGTVDGTTPVEQAHHDFASASDLTRVLDGLAHRLLADT